MAMIARMPLAVAPGMGVNAYFSYTVVGFMGIGRISYQVGNTPLAGVLRASC